MKIPYTLPKAEMHVHISLALSNETFIRRVKKKRTDLSLDFLVERETRYYPTLEKFHGTYESMRHMTNTVQELADTVQAYLERIAREGAIYAEISNSFRDEVQFIPQMEAVTAGIEAARDNTGIETRIVVTTLRNHGAEKAEEAVSFLKNYNHPLITGFGLVGDEGVNEFMDFSRALHMAWHDAGLGLTPHVAEQYLHNAVDFLHAVPSDAFTVNDKDHRRLRIGHGVLIHTSTELMRQFADKKICMEMCLSANKRIGLPTDTQQMRVGDMIETSTGSTTINNPLDDYFEKVGNHPIKKFIDVGIPICLGSDNPLLMNTNIGKEHSLAYNAGVTNMDDHLNMTRNAITYANVDFETRARLLKLLDSYQTHFDETHLPSSTILGYQKAFVD